MVDPSNSPVEHPPLRNKVLFLGTSPSAKRFVVRELFRISGQKVPQQLLAEPAAEPAQDAVSLPFRVDNKYYTADLDLWVDAAPDAPGTEVVAAYEPVARAIDALVFVFTDPSSFSEISPWADFVRRWEPAVALCVRAPSATPVAEQVIDAFGWCVDNGFEYIDLTTDDPESGDVSRIYEALQGNPWQGLSRKGSVPAGPQPAGDLLPDHDAGLPSQLEIELMRRRIFSREDGDAFTEMVKLRDYAQTLPDPERRRLAAQIALSFGEELDAADRNLPSPPVGR